MKKIINTNDAPAAVGPYSQGYVAGNFLFVSGQIPFDPKTNALVSSDVAIQTKQSLDNILAIVKEAGFEKEDIVKCQIFLSDMNNFAIINEVYASFFGSHKPARAAVEVSRLPKDVDVEIDAICYRAG